MGLRCLMWLVWKERHSLTFKDIERSLDQLKSLLIHTLFEWFRAWGFTHCTCILEFHNSLGFSI